MNLDCEVLLGGYHYEIFIEIGAFFIKMSVY